MKVVECDGRKILKVDPKGLEELSKAAYSDVSFYLRAAHLQKLRDILEDREATDNDKFVAYTMLLNQCVSAEGELPTCQDTGTAICIGHKGEDVWTGRRRRRVHRPRRLRDLQGAQSALLAGRALHDDRREELGHQPPRPDRHLRRQARHGVRILFITKGGGSANKTFLYQQTKALLNEESLTKFITEHIKDLGTSACPPYHLALCIGGTSAEMCLSTVKKASAGYLTSCPPRATRADAASATSEWERKVLRSAGRAASAPSSAANTSCTTSA